MRLRLGCRFEHDAAAPTAAIVLVEPHFDAAGGIVAERWVSEPPVEATGYVDLYGNRCRRLVLPEGVSAFSYDALVTVSADPDAVPGPEDVQHRIEALPDEPSTGCWQVGSASPTRLREGLGAVRRHDSRRRAGAGCLRLDPRQRRVRGRERADDGDGRGLRARWGHVAGTSPIWA